MDIAVEAAEDGAATCLLTNEAIRRRELRVKLGREQYAVRRLQPHILPDPTMTRLKQ
jgi:hypothetical protein